MSVQEATSLSHSALEPEQITSFDPANSDQPPRDNEISAQAVTDGQLRQRMYLKPKQKSGSQEKTYLITIHVDKAQSMGEGSREKQGFIVEGISLVTQIHQIKARIRSLYGVPM